jgi:hypothetical protein
MDSILDKFIFVLDSRLRGNNEENNPAVPGQSKSCNPATPP